MSYYELNLGYQIPDTYLHKSGRRLYNKGHVPHNKGRKYDELYGPERSAAIRKRISETAKGRYFSPDRAPSHSRPVVRVTPSCDVIHYASLRQSARVEGVTPAAIKGRIEHCRAINGRWFYEDDGDKMQAYINSLTN